MRKQTYALLAVAALSAALLAVTLVVLLPGAKGAARKAAPAAGDPVIVAAGDIACDPADHNFAGGAGSPNGCHMKATSQLIRQQNPTAVLTLGDDQYEDGELSKFEKSYALSWGRFKNITHPAIGNHEYNDPGGGASGYFDYFGRAAGNPSQGYYSYDLGSWHMVELNSECRHVGGCEFGSPQERWLRNDLAAHPAACTLAYWHEPRWSSGQHGSNPAYGAFWTDLYEAGADVVLVGHDHDYERFAPQSPTGRYEAARGVREFVVGTGGKNHYPIGHPIANSQVRNDDTFGVLRLTLHPTSYDWRFVPEAGGSFTDSGTGACVRRAGSVLPPPRIRHSWFRDRFESGNLSRWTTVKGLRVERRQMHRGNWGVIARSTTGKPAYAFKRLGSARKGMAYRLWFNVIHQSSTKVVDLAKLRTDRGAALISVFIAPSGLIGYQNNVTRQSTYSGVPVSHGVWHSLEIRARVRRGKGEVETWLDGHRVKELTKSEAFGKTPIRSIQLGENIPGRTYAVVFDDVIAGAWRP
jgi:Calcineurin-like phosphoesterase